ncbi:MAG: DUF4012 domain-containing protein [Chloroflexota bacterium]
MSETRPPLEEIKYILENLRLPERLDDHPWARSLTVQEQAAQDPSLAGKSPGQQLAQVIGDLFRQTMPATPPQHGKRLDTRWGRFGILAAYYFAPHRFGRLQPRSLREAWRRIDQAILLFVYGAPANELKPGQVQPYQLIGDELDFPANSTISDWHRSGLQDLADLFLSHENHLKDTQASQPDAPVQAPPEPLRKQGRRWVWLALLAALLLGLSLLGVEAYRLARLAQTVRQDIAELERLNPSALDEATLAQVQSSLEKTYQDIEALRSESAPWLGLTRRLGWVPVYGGDLQHLGDLLEMASGLVDSARRTMQTAYPIWELVKQSEREIKAGELTSMLLETRPALEQAQVALLRAQSARERIDVNSLSSEVRPLVLRVDPYLDLLDEGLSTALAVPSLLGATDEGPKTYLVLIQNEDELRATGGFLTAAAKVIVANGEILSYDLEDSYAVDDLSKPYPVAPWQLRNYMNLPVLFFRDSNWYPDFPTTVKWAEYLYVFSEGASVDGVIAIDQHVLATLLSVTGPLRVEEIDATISAENIRQVMRQAKLPSAETWDDPNWHRKQFMNPIAAAILERLLAGRGLSWETLLKAMLQELDQRHIQAQVDEPDMARLLAARGWDGAMRPGAGDFLMVVGSNVGYNKTNAVVETSLAYDVDLADPSAPASHLAVFHRNHAVGDPLDCPSPYEVNKDNWYAINRCYVDYLRVYLPSGTQLVDSRTTAVLRSDDPWLKADVPGGVDILEEPIQGVQGFGTLLLVKMGQGLGTDFEFSLPASVVQADPGGGLLYRLHIQKQAGTGSIPLTLRVHLPAQAGDVTAVPAESARDGTNLLFNLELRTDLSIEIRFRP